MTREIVNLLQAIAHILEVTSSPGNCRKKKVVTCSSMESEYQAMAETTREMVWLRSFLEDLDISSPSLMPMHYDNQAAIFITDNSTFHERTKHIEIDCHYI